MVAGDDTDIGIISVADLGEWAERGDVVAVPASLRAADHPFQWSGVLPAYREQLIEWGGQARALPLAGDGSVVVYRADRLSDPAFIEAFRKQYGRPPAAPTSWDEFADLATALTTYDRKPSLPSLAPADLTDLFFRVAASHDRRALNDVDIARRGGGLEPFQFNLTSGEPRLDAPSFRAAAEWLGTLAAKGCLPPTTNPTDPAAALGDGRASLALLSLGQLARLPRENGAVPARFGIAPVPGARSYFDPKKGQLVPTATPNYIPYFAGGVLGVVRTGCRHQAAAFDLLAELGGPARSLEMISNPALGAGPFRAAHLDRDRLLIWFGYGFDADRSKLLQDAMRQYVRPEVANRAHGLRGPDQRPLTAAATDALTRIVAGAPADAVLGQLTTAWTQIDQKTPKDTLLRWRKLAAGLN